MTAVAARVTVIRRATAVLIEVDTAAGQLARTWLGRWRAAVAAAMQHPDDTSFDDGSTYVAARVRHRRAGPLLDLADELKRGDAP